MQAFTEKMEQLNLKAQQAEVMANTCIAPLTLACTAEADCQDAAADHGNNANIDIFVQDVGILMPVVDVGPPYALCCADLEFHTAPSPDCVFYLKINRRRQIRFDIFLPCNCAGLR